MAMSLDGFAQGVASFQNGGTSEFYFGSVNTNNRVTSAPFYQQPASGSTSTGVLDVGLFWSYTSFSDLSSGTVAGLGAAAFLLFRWRKSGNNPGLATSYIKEGICA